MRNISDLLRMIWLMLLMF